VFQEHKSPCITKDGYFDVTKIPIEHIPKQTLSVGEDKVWSSLSALKFLYQQEFYLRQTESVLRDTD